MYFTVSYLDHRCILLCAYTNPYMAIAHAKEMQLPSAVLKAPLNTFDLSECLYFHP